MWHRYANRVTYGQSLIDLPAPSLGLWALEMSQQFPNANVIGLDLTPPVKPQRSHNDGLVYVQGDVTKELGLVSNAFEFVYQRDMATVVPVGRWPTLIQEFARILKPGGWLQLVEYGKDV